MYTCAAELGLNLPRQAYDLILSNHEDQSRHAAIGGSVRTKYNNYHRQLSQLVVGDNERRLRAWLH